MKRYKITERIKLERDFQRLFKTDFRKYCDIHLTIINRYLTIDLIKFDDEFLRKKFGDYEDMGKSALNVVMDNFGKEAARLIYSLI